MFPLQNQHSNVDSYLIILQIVLKCVYAFEIWFPFIICDWKAGHRISCTDLVFFVNFPSYKGAQLQIWTPCLNFVREKQLNCTHFTAFPVYLTEAQRYPCNKMDYSWFVISFRWLTRTESIGYSSWNYTWQSALTIKAKYYSTAPIINILDGIIDVQSYINL